MKAEKILILGIDGMDPSLTNRFRREGKLPNLDRLISEGSARADLEMLGGVPTITPPMWTTLATGATPATHGITCFWGQSPKDMATFTYNLNSHRCKAEQLWNVLAEAGKKTLVWHWPGSSWPPSSDSENLHVVDGTQPSSVNNGDCTIDDDKIIYAAKSVKKVLFQPKIKDNSGAGCVLSDVPVEKDATAGYDQTRDGISNLILSIHEGDPGADMLPVDVVNSPITDPSNWGFTLDEGALEFTAVIYKGLARRPALILPNAQGDYDRVAIYRSKKSEKPLAILRLNELVENVLDEVSDGKATIKINRHMRILELDPKAEFVKIWFGPALDIYKDDVWHPRKLKESIINNVGPVPATTMANARDDSLVKTVLLPSWDVYVDWQSNSLNHLIKNEQYDVVFSHLHNVDACGHLFWYLAKEREGINNKYSIYQDAMEWAYKQVDRYVGQFLHLLDEGWTIFIVSDHGLLTPPEDKIPLLGDGFGCNVRVLEELGYTVLKKDENGQELREIDYSKTKAVANRGNHIHINLKGRNPEGIVEPQEKYGLEKQIINDLYNYRQDGERIISLALRNKDAAILGLSGDECGDIIYFLEEGYNRLHGDSLPTVKGLYETSLSPIFIAAGKGIKKGFTTERVIRITDVAPTVASLVNVRMPEHCEGAPIYQIIE